MVSHDVVSRRAEQLSNLAQAQRTLANAIERDEQSIEQSRRQQTILARQMRELQEALRNSRDSVRVETNERLNNMANELNWQIEQAGNLPDNAARPALQQLAGTIATNLEGMRLMSRLDNSLSNSIIEGRRRLADRVGSADDAIAALAQDLKRSSARPEQAAEVLEQLAAGRTLHRTGESGDREFASDLGNARRALAEVLADPSPVRAAQLPRTVAIADALQTLAAVNSVNTASNFVRELMRRESWSMSSTAALTEHPRLWEAYSQGLEQAVKQLREARVPNEIIDKLERRALECSGAARCSEN